MAKDETTVDDVVTAADINKMTRKELVELIDENKLDVDHASIKTLPPLKKAVLKVLELEEEPEETEEGEGKVYTYIGGGADSPRIINFMGRQKFVRGQATKVTEPALLEKLKGHPTFVEGEADEETLFKIDEEGKAEEDAQRAQDKITNATYTKKFRGEK